MKRTTSIALAGIGLLSLGTIAVAQTAPAAPQRSEARAPMDRATLEKRLGTMFDAADANRDGTLTVEERKAHQAQMRGKMREQIFSRLDANNDGSISKEEFAARPERGGMMADGKRERGHEGKRRGHGGHGGMHGMGGGMMMRGELAQYRDKPIPRATFVQAGLAGFDRVDANRDGKISGEERQAARKTMMERRNAEQRPAQTTPAR
ncbi:MAG: EF-hand domain-containing protein [Alphaproteobacteria bacterium]|nr:EF-hand domain-containing protein [Alphaproteobacteria bacterium]MBU0793275.1 EF-hand domain-containing protein [Alphaproteobacteria bacterium]MBU0876240.1 EF-hand domain-containing protein [Alphaproteobacteria bacterium]MBU1768165.1 EF-hand domain-containing protein [Alphaproteobacteria bacterium]